MKYIYLVLFPLAALLAQAAHARPEPQSYQECLLQATWDGYVDDRRDIGRVKQMCEERFPRSAPDIIGETLTSKQLDNVDLYAHRRDDGGIGGSVYNGNPDLVITRLEVLLTPRGGDSVRNFFDSEEYRINLKVRPYKTESFEIDRSKTSIDGEFSPRLIRAWGY